MACLTPLVKDARRALRVGYYAGGWPNFKGQFPKSPIDPRRIAAVVPLATLPSRFAVDLLRLDH